MQKTLMTVLGLGLAAAVHAVPISFSDVINPSNKIGMSNSGNNVYSFTHDILDDGFNTQTDNILGADIYITLYDDFDQPSENVRIKLDNLIADQSLEVDYGTYHFTVNSTLLQNDGKLVVTLNVLSGDFWFDKSELNVLADRAAVPEPSSIALTGLGLLGLGFAARRRKKA